MHKLEPVCHPVLGFTWKGKSSLLAGETAVSYLIDVINLWQTVHHIAIGQMPKLEKIQVTKACVPPPSRATPLCRQTHGPTNVELQCVKPVCNACHLHHKDPVLIPDLEVATEQ
jgi:hypothetical protein